MKSRNAVLGIVAIASLATGGIAVGGTAAADGGHHGRQKTVKVRFLPTGIVQTDLGHVCDSGGQCVYSSTETSVTQTGDAQGSTVQADVTSVGNSTTLLSLSLGTFTGSINGCGTGQFLYSGHATADYAANTVDVVYLIEAGSGTGDLTGISGVFTQHDTLDSTTAAPIVGAVRCTVAH